MTSNQNEEETLVFVDFTEKLPSDILKSKVFFRVANLDTPNPLVQVNDLIFKGTVQQCLGTNMFFKKTEQNNTLEFPYKETSSTKLDFLSLQTKVISCKQMKVTTNEIVVPEVRNDNVKFNLNWNYKTLLKKIENGTLDFKNLTNESEEQPVENAEEPCGNENFNISEDENVEVNETKVSENMEVEEIPQDIQNHEVIEKQLPNELSEAYQNLLLLASTPVKRQISEDLEVQCLPSFKNDFEYRSIECKILTRPLFSYHNQQKDNINIQRSVLFGLLAPSNTQHRVLTDEEKNAVLTIENLENLDLPARLVVLTAQMKEMETQIELNAAEQNSEEDKFGHSPLETLNMYQRLVNALQKRIQEIGEAV